MPERFIDVIGTLTDDDPGRYVFGLGRRICPGALYHSNDVWHLMSHESLKAGLLLIPFCGLPL
jgi:hypothetical protein